MSSDDSDPYVAFLAHVLRRIKDPEQRVAWMHRNLPVTAGLLGFGRNWEDLAALADDDRGGCASGSDWRARAE